jgi:hypothetical protein
LSRAAFLLAVGACMACASCRAPDLNDTKPLPELDAAFFRCRVHPVLARSCGALACHGDARRPFHVYARNRLRAFGGEPDRDALLAPDELRASFDAARAFVDADAPDQSPLLMKPLDQRAGGAFHRGAEIFGGGNVFLSADDPERLTLRAWVLGAKEDPSCDDPAASLF